jgi:hypothetical protein
LHRNLGYRRSDLFGKGAGQWPNKPAIARLPSMSQRRLKPRVARHLAEATYWILAKEEEYREPRWKQAASTKA